MSDTSETTVDSSVTDRSSLSELEEQAFDMSSILACLEELQISPDNPDYSPIMNLPKDVEYLTLQQLDFQSYINLALTCHKWYNLAATAPKYLKPTLKLDRITLKEDTLTGSVLDDDWNPIPILHWPMETDYKLVNPIQASQLCLQKSEYVSRELIEYLDKHAHVFQFKKVIIEIEEFHVDKSCFIDFLGRFEDIFVQKNSQEKVVRKFFREWEDVIKESLHLESIEFGTFADSRFCRVIADQLLEGKRPNLQRFATNIYTSVAEPWKYILKNLKNLKGHRDDFVYRELVQLPDGLPWEVEFLPFRRNAWYLTLCVENYYQLEETE